MTKLLALPLALCLSAAACDLSGIDEGIGCPLGAAIADSFGPPDRVGELAVAEASITCPFRFLFSACEERPLAVGAKEGITVALRTGAPFSVESSAPSVLVVTGFTPADTGCGTFSSGSIFPAAPGEASVIMRGEDGVVVDRIPFRVQKPARLIPDTYEPIHLRVGQEIVIGVSPENKIGDSLHASDGFSWSLDTDGIIEFRDPPAAFRTVRAMAPGIVQVDVTLAGASTSMTLVVE